MNGLCDDFERYLDYDPCIARQEIRCRVIDESFNTITIVDERGQEMVLHKDSLEGCHSGEPTCFSQDTDICIYVLEHEYGDLSMSA